MHCGIFCFKGKVEVCVQHPNVVHYVLRIQGEFSLSDQIEKPSFGNKLDLFIPAPKTFCIYVARGGVVVSFLFIKNVFARAAKNLI